MTSAAPPSAKRTLPPSPHGWRLAALLLAVLAAHGWLLSRWLHGNTQANSSYAIHNTSDAPEHRSRAVEVMPQQADTTIPGAASPTVRVTTTSHPETPTPTPTPTPAPAPAPLPVPTSSPTTGSASASNTDDKKIIQKRPLTLSQKESTATHSEIQHISIRAGTTPLLAVPSGENPGNVAADLQATPYPVDISPPQADDTSTGLAATVPLKLKVPPTITLTYDVKGTRKGISFPASSTLRLTHDGHGYEARLEIKALWVGSRIQTSKGHIDPVAGFQPLRFGDKTKTELATHFDRSRQPPLLRFSANTPDTPLQVHTQDRLSVLFQLAAMFSGDPKRMGTGTTVVVHTAGPRDADMWQFKVGRAEALSLPAGPLTAIHLVRTPTHAYDNQVEVWLAPSLGHLPVRVLWTQANGDVVDQRLAGHEP